MKNTSKSGHPLLASFIAIGSLAGLANMALADENPGDANDGLALQGGANPDATEEPDGLAPLGSVQNPIVLDPEGREDVFAFLLKRNATRIDVEVIAILGENYLTNESFDGPKLREAIINSLTTTGKSAGSPAGEDGSKVHRVTKLSEAKSLLEKTWPDKDFGVDSEIGVLFEKYPKASIAFMEGDHTLIFFFDKNDQFAAAHPS